MESGNRSPLRLHESPLKMAVVVEGVSVAGAAGAGRFRLKRRNFRGKESSLRLLLLLDLAERAPSRSLRRMWSWLVGKRDAVESKEVLEIGDVQPSNPFTELQVLAGHTDIVRLLVRLDDYRFASAGDDCRVIIWNVKSGEKMHVCQGHSRPITAMTVLSTAVGDLEIHKLQSTVLLTASSDKTIIMWDINTGQPLKILANSEGSLISVKCLLVLREEALWLSGGKYLLLWSQDGTLLSKVATHRQEEVSSLIRIKDSLVAAAMGKCLVLYGLEYGKETPRQRQLQQLKALTVHAEHVHSLLSLQGGWFASGSLDGELILWNSGNLAEHRKVALHAPISPQLQKSHCSQAYPCSIAHLSTDSQCVFAAVGSGICVYDLTSQRLVACQRNAHNSQVLQVVKLQESGLLVSCSEDGTTRIWKLHSPAAAQLPRRRTASERWSLGLVGDLIGHSGALQMLLDFEKHGLASCSTDQLIIVWKEGERASLYRNSLARNLNRHYQQTCKSETTSFDDQNII
ncbi:WD repeat-containing protein 41 isoform X1 [Petromyzon marinus]|uniref:WD repeat-containing protein 41 isoform X1 n=2 Tax=Petromyzon marinus TaxID=7757 RepID=A0AAJ7XD08_PETMA|nr:WD repeat-containing protein 41 isoform X1 [Petromyzon marinus]